MQFSINIVLLLAAVTSSLPTEELCGPSSNCDIIYDPDGTRHISFKPGMEPGSEDYEARFDSANLAKRQEPIVTDVELGETQTDYGCEVVPVDLFDRLHEICHNTSACDAGTPIEQGMQWMPTGDEDSSVPSDAHPQDFVLSVTAEGSYPGSEVDLYIDAIKAVPIDGAVKYVEQAWMNNDMNQHFQWSAVEIERGTCRMTKFSNFLQVTKHAGNNVMGHISVKIENNVENASGAAACAFATGTLGAIVGAINGLAGTALGAVSAVCGGLKSYNGD